MIKAEAGRECGVRVVAAGTTLDMALGVLDIIQASVTSIVASGDAAEALARAFEKGGQQHDGD